MKEFKCDSTLSHFEQEFKLFGLEIDEYQTMPFYDVTKPYEQCSVLRNIPTSYSTATTLNPQPHK